MLATTGRLHHRHRRQLGEYERQNVHSGAITGQYCSGVPEQYLDQRDAQLCTRNCVTHFNQLYPGTDVGRAESRPASVLATGRLPSPPATIGQYERQNVHSGAITGQYCSGVPERYLDQRDATVLAIVALHFNQLYPGTDVGRAESRPTSVLT